VKDAEEVQRLVGRRETVTVLRILCEDAWLFTAANAVKADAFSAESKGSVRQYGALA
jgi:hypothetical protein